MIQRSKIIRSRDEWREKAIQRANDLRDSRKTKKRQREKIAELKIKIGLLEETNKDKKTNTSDALPAVIDISEARQTRILCTQLVLQAVVSYRSVPRILNLFNTTTPLQLSWIPHFTSVINWSLRLGLGLLKQVAPISQPWVAIIDHSIDIGTKKALVVLRVSLDALSQRQGAIRLTDCECIGLKICEKVNGDSISQDLEEIFNRSGIPKGIIKDCDYTLQKGVRLYAKKQPDTIPVIEDIGHVMASALKAQFEESSGYKHFTTLAANGAKRLRQTDLAFLIPPKLRSKGRFQSVGKIGKWGEKMLDVLAVKGRAKKGSVLAKLRAALPGFCSSRAFIQCFAKTASVTSQVMALLKNRGLDQDSYEQCQQLAEQLPRNSKVKKRLLTWLEYHIEIQREITTLPLLVSSDIIESLFGNFKHIIERSPQADMNRTTLLIPALCGKRDEITIAQALSKTCHGDLKCWEQENIPYTMQKKRQAFFLDAKA